MSEPAQGVLTGVRIIEMGGAGPGPFAGMMLADHGAEVIRIDRPGGGLHSSPKDILSRGRRSIAIELKSPEGVAIARDLCRTADGLIEGFRPGVMERIGLGPSELCQDNPALVYGRVTGWGQSGPNARKPGHDINYIAVTGALHACGRAGAEPTIPLNLLGDGGGGLMLAFGMVSAILKARETGKGQVVDCAMADAVSTLMALIWRFRAEGLWSDDRGTNMLDGGAPYYDTYETADGRHVSIGAVGPHFHDRFREAMGITADPDFASFQDRTAWPRQRARLADMFRTKTRSDWCELLDEADICFAPVLSITEAPLHPHLVARDMLIEIGGITQPAPAPRFMGTPAARPARIANPGDDSEAVLASLGYAPDKIARLMTNGTVTAAAGDAPQFSRQGSEQ